MIIFTVLACLLFSQIYQEIKDDMYNKKTETMLEEQKENEWKSTRY